MKRLVIGFLSITILSIGITLAQTDPTTPAVPQATATATLSATPLSADDPRLAVCTAPTLPGFVPYIVQPGDRLPVLLTGVENVTVTQVAALNCLDDPNWLPIGMILWLPENLLGVEVAFPIDDTNPAVDNATITNFRANAEVVTNREGVTFTWAAEGSEAYLYACPEDIDFDCFRPFNAMQVPVAHTVTIGGFQYRGPVRYRLEVVDGAASVTQDIRLRIECAQLWIAPTNDPARCADAPAQPVFAAWQPFEEGVMIWFSDSRQIYVLHNEGHRAEVFADPYLTGQPEPTTTPPDNRVIPVRGFGLVWRELGASDGDLGWALVDEIGFDSARQPAGLQSYTTYIQGPGATVYAVTIIPGTDAGYWMQVAG